MISDQLLMSYLDGEVSRDEATEVETALAHDALLRDRLLALRAMDRQFTDGMDALLQRPVPDRLVDLIMAAAMARKVEPNLSAVARIDDARARSARTSGPSPLRPSRGGWRATPPWVGWAVAAQLCILVTAGVMVQMQAQTRPAATLYRALGRSPVTPSVNAIVMFQPTTTEGALRAAVMAAHAQIVGGPTDAGAYLLHVDGAERTAALAKLRKGPNIVLAQPVDSSGAGR